MCKCNTNTNAFKLKVAEAKEKSTKRKPYAVYFEEFVGRGSFPFVATVKWILANEAICCYYNNEGEKVDK